MPVDPARLVTAVDVAGDIGIEGDHLNAERFLVEHGARVRYSPELGCWLVWNGAWWQEDRNEVVRDLARQTIDNLRPWVGEAASDADFKRRSRHYADSTRSGRRDGLLSLARSYRSVSVTVATLDQHRHLLACRNGTVDLQTGTLRGADPGDLITRGVAVDFDPDASSEEWDAFLHTIFGGDGELISFVKRLAGYSMTGETSEHLLPIAHGTGANGKSTFIGAVVALLGEHATVAPEGLLVEGKHEQHPERLAALRGRRLVISSELEHRAVLAESLVKSITGGDRISARHMYGQRFEFEPTHTAWLVTNHTPKVRGTDEAIWRRLRMVPFNVTIPAKDRIPDYGRYLAKHHGAAILAWLVAGAVEWYRDGLGEAEQVRQATFDYRQREDVFQHWLDECTVTITGRTRVKVLLASWRDWAKAAGTSGGRDQDFAEALESHGTEVFTYEKTRHARGIGLLSESPGQGYNRDPSVPLVRGVSSTRAHEEVYGRGVPRGPDNGETPGQSLAERFDFHEPPLSDEDFDRLAGHDEIDAT